MNTIDPRFFVVGIVVFEGDIHKREELRQVLKTIERDSGKGTKKWSKATIKQSMAYMQQVLEQPDFQNTLFCQEFSYPTRQLDATLQASANAILHIERASHKAAVFIDALDESDRNRASTRLRKLGVSTKSKPKGLDDTKDEFIRLADAVAGLVGATIKQKSYAASIYEDAVKKERLIRL